MNEISMGIENSPKTAAALRPSTRASRGAQGEEAQGEAPSRGERRRQRELERDLARHNERLYAVHIGAATRAAGFRRRGWLRRIFGGR